MTRKTMKVSVSERALVQRINRALAKDDRVLKKARSGRARFDLGEYYILDRSIPSVVEDHCDLEKVGRELGALTGWEQLAD